MILFFFTIAIVSTMIIPSSIFNTVQASFNPFEGLFGGKSEEQRKQEIYKVVKDRLASQIESCEKALLQPCAAKNVDAVELTDGIYEEEKLEGKEFSDFIITGKVGEEVIKEIWK